MYILQQRLQRDKIVAQRFYARVEFMRMGNLQRVFSIDPLVELESVLKHTSNFYGAESRIALIHSLQKDLKAHEKNVYDDITMTQLEVWSNHMTSNKLMTDQVK
jgi:hypothetical protein